MKAHEQAKSLGIKFKELVNYLAGVGDEIKSPNQELTVEQLSFSLNAITMPDSLNFNKADSVLTISFCKELTIKLQRLHYENAKVVFVETVETATFPSREQSFQHVEYLLAKIEMGDYEL